MRALTLYPLLAVVFMAGACAASSGPAPIGPPSAPAAPAAEDRAAERGLVLAREACARCHAVAPGEVSRNTAAPPFEAIAAMPGMTTTALNVWLHSAHPSMPNIPVSAEEAQDIHAYLRSLKAARGRS